MTTLTVLAALVAAPLLFGILLAVALGGYMVLQFAPDLVHGLRASSAPAVRAPLHLKAATSAQDRPTAERMLSPRIVGMAGRPPARAT
jgi:hypothetical protein